MKFKNISAGFLVGVTGGVLIAVLNAPKSGKDLTHALKSGSGSIKSQFGQIKTEVDEIKTSFLKTKHESQEVFNDLGDEIKTLISNFQSDIKPNMDIIQEHVENLQNRGESVSESFSKGKE